METSGPYGASVNCVMHGHVYQRYPQFVDAVQALQANDATFREVCADYEEICTWLAAHDVRTSSPDLDEWANALELKRDLEDEIMKLLEAYDANIK